MSGNKRVFFDVEAGGEKLGKVVMEVRDFLLVLELNSGFRFHFESVC